MLVVVPSAAECQVGWAVGEVVSCRVGDRSKSFLYCAARICDFSESGDCHFAACSE